MLCMVFFFFQAEDGIRDVAVTGVQTCALPICELRTVIGAIGDDRGKDRLKSLESLECVEAVQPILQPFKLASREVRREATVIPDRKSTRLNSSHGYISYAVFCLKKKKKISNNIRLAASPRPTRTVA